MKKIVITVKGRNSDRKNENIVITMEKNCNYFQKVETATQRTKRLIILKKIVISVKLAKTATEGTILINVFVCC